MRNGECKRPRQFPAGPVQGVEARAAADILARHLPHHNFGIRINVEFPCVERDRVLQRFHQGRIFRDVVVLVADPFCNPYRTFRTPPDHDSNARRPGIPQATAVYIRYQFGHHFFMLLRSNRVTLQEAPYRGRRLRGTFPFFEDAPISRLSQDDYLIPFHHFAVFFFPVQVTVQNADRFQLAVYNFFHSSHLRFRLCTARTTLTAPIVCVDFSSYSGNFACVDGRKGWHNKTSQREVD